MEQISRYAIARETEKAIALKAWGDKFDSKTTFSFPLWIPKSLIKNDEVPAWFIGKKMKEAVDFYDLARIPVIELA